MEKMIRPDIIPSASNKSDVESIKTTFINILEQVIGKDEYTATEHDLFKAAALFARAKMMKKWIDTQQKYHKQNKRRVYYLSLEFLIGRLLEDSILNLGLEENSIAALKAMNIDYRNIVEEEPDAGLGNGGLGRLAACFLDSMATLNIPSHGYGIRYNYGIFKQDIQDGYQVERPDDWLKKGNPWEIERFNHNVRIKFYGKVEHIKDKNGKLKVNWVDTDDVIAVAYDTPVPGFETKTVNTLRLWSSKAVEEFNLDSFNFGDYIKSCENMIYSENISKVLYPNDSMSVGKELRLKQQYFFTSASIQDIIRRYKAHSNDMSKMHEKVVIQLNDTHPTLAIPELMRILIDEEDLNWDQAWNVVSNTFAYSNHTLMPEALEKWSCDFFQTILPRHLEIIYEINRRFSEELKKRFPKDPHRVARMSIIEDSNPKMVRMAYLATVASFSVNGVSALHSKLLKEQLFKDFYEIYPNKFNNKTNGIAQRRWLYNINEHLSNLIENTIGRKWITDLYDLKKLEKLANDASFRKKWDEAKKKNKEKLAKHIEKEHGVKVNTDAMFDMQSKRFHEYKRQLLCVMNVIHMYNEIKKNPNKPFVPRVVIFAGKAAPAYMMAKLIIKLINNVSQVVNNDPKVGDKLKVFFLKDYNVSLASKMFPASDLSEQISTAGMEASGTGNMKYSLNGALTIGTLDGANIEIMEEVGEENIFIFGLKEQEVRDLRAKGYNPKYYYETVHELKDVIDILKSGYFSPGDPDLFNPIIDILMNHGDYYMHMADFKSYIDTQKKVSELYKNKDEWIKKSIINVANMGKFSSDRTILEYAEEIWKVKGEEG